MYKRQEYQISKRALPYGPKITTFNLEFRATVLGAIMTAPNSTRKYYGIKRVSQPSHTGGKEDPKRVI